MIVVGPFQPKYSILVYFPLCSTQTESPFKKTTHKQTPPQNKTPHDTEHHQEIQPDVLEEELA